MQISIYFTDLGTVEGTVIGPTGMPATGITVVAYKDVTPPLSILAATKNSISRTTDIKIWRII
jgi:hypothetical protein